MTIFVVSLSIAHLSSEAAVTDMIMMSTVTRALLSLMLLYMLTAGTAACLPLTTRNSGLSKQI